MPCGAPKPNAAAAPCPACTRLRRPLPAARLPVRPRGTAAPRWPWQPRCCSPRGPRPWPGGLLRRRARGRESALFRRRCRQRPQLPARAWRGRRLQQCLPWRRPAPSQSRSQHRHCSRLRPFLLRPALPWRPRPRPRPWPFQHLHLHPRPHPNPHRRPRLRVPHRLPPALRSRRSLRRRLLPPPPPQQPPRQNPAGPGAKRPPPLSPRHRPHQRQRQRQRSRCGIFPTASAPSSPHCRSAA